MKPVSFHEQTSASPPTATQEAGKDMELLKEYLFSRKDRRLINIKMTRGDTECTPAQLRKELLSMMKRRDAGLLKPTGPARTKRPTVNVRELVAGLDTSTQEAV